MIQKSHLYALVIPVLNENGRLTNQLIQIKELCPEADVIIADGGSTDGSTEPSLLRELGVSTLLTKTGPGKLSAQLRMAIDYCLSSNYQAIITMDGNGKDGVEGVSEIIHALNEGFDFVQGSRFVEGGISSNTPLHRLLAIKLLHIPITNLAAKYRFTDTTNGFRGHSVRLLQDQRIAPLREIFDSYELLAYLPIRSGQLNFRITEVPVSRSYPKGDEIPTKIHGLAAHTRMIKILFKAAAGSYRPKQKRREQRTRNA